MVLSMWISRTGLERTERVTLASCLSDGVGCFMAQPLPFSHMLGLMPWLLQARKPKVSLTFHQYNFKLVRLFDEKGQSLSFQLNLGKRFFAEFSSVQKRLLRSDKIHPSCDIYFDVPRDSSLHPYVWDAFAHSSL